MIMPNTDQIVKILACHLNVNMVIVRDEKRLTVIGVELDITEEYAVSVDYKDGTGEMWSTYYRADQVVSIEYKKGQNVINIL